MPRPEYVSELRFQDTNAMEATMMRFPLTLTHLLERAGRLFPTSAIVSRLPDKSLHRYRYADFVERTARLGGALQALGLEPGDRVATLMWNHYAHLEAYFGIPCSGGVVHTLNLRLAPDEIGYIASHARDRFLIVDDVLLPLYERFKHAAPFEHVIVVPFSGAAVPPPFASYETLIADAPPAAWPQLEEDAAAAMCYTSGTTGRPKGVVYSHRSLMLHSLGNRPSRRGGAATPRHALSGGADVPRQRLGAPLHGGDDRLAAGVPWPAPRRHQPARPLRIRTGDDCRRRPDDLGRHPPCARRRPRRLVAADGHADAGGRGGGSRVDDPRVRPVWATRDPGVGDDRDLTGGHHQLPEARARASGGGRALRAAAKQGVPLPLVEVRIMTPDGEAPWDGTTVGELEVRGAWIAGGYHSAVTDADRWTADGWLRTGDVASIDAHGYVKITDRIKDLVKSGGEWISSVDLENAL
jgi:fatty-acyl-CoA synthase